MPETPALRYVGPADSLGLPDPDALRALDPSAAARLDEFRAALRIGHDRGTRVAVLHPAADRAWTRALAVLLRPGPALRARLRERMDRVDAFARAFGGPADRAEADHIRAVLEDLETFADSPDFDRADPHRPAGDVLWGVECTHPGDAGAPRRTGLTIERCSWDWAAVLLWPDELSDVAAVFPTVLGFAELSDPNRTCSAFLAWHTDAFDPADGELRTVASPAVHADYLLACLAPEDAEGFTGRLIAGLGTGTLHALIEDYPSFASPELRRDVLRLVPPLPEVLDHAGLPRGPKRLRKLVAQELRAAWRRRHRRRVDRAEEVRIQARRAAHAEPRPPDRFPPHCTVRALTPLDRERLLAWVRSLAGVLDASISWDGAGPDARAHALRIEWRTAAGPHHLDLPLNDHRPLRDVVGEHRSRLPCEEDPR